MGSPTSSPSRPRIRQHFGTRYSQYVAGDFIDAPVGVNVNFGTNTDPRRPVKTTKPAWVARSGQISSNTGLSTSASSRRSRTISEAQRQTLTSAVPLLLAADNSVPFADSRKQRRRRPRRPTTSHAFLTDQNVAPSITEPANDSVVHANAQPLIAWSGAGAGVSNPLHQFYVEFWSGTGTSSLRVAPADPSSRT